MHQNLTILIVDDEASIRNGLSRVIPWDQLNITVLSTAQDGFEALELIQKYKPNIVLTDIKMPGCDGLTLIQKAKELEQAKDTRFIIISGYDDFTYAQTAMRYGVRFYLLKPIKEEELLHLMQEVVQEIRAEQHRSSSLQSNRNLLMETQALKEKFFTRLLQNEFANENDILDEINSFGFTLQNRQLQVIVFYYNTSPGKTGSNVEKETYLQLKLKVRQTIENILINIPNITFEYQNHSLLTIINTSDLTTNGLLSSTEFCQLCISQVMEFSPIQIHAGIGEEVSSLMQVCESLTIALEALSYMLYETSQRIFDGSDICKTTQANVSANHMDNNALIDAIYRGSREDMLEITTAFFNSFFTAKTPSPSFIRGMCIYLVIDVQKQLSLYLEENNGLFSEKPYLVINQLPFFSQIKEWIINQFLDYMEYLRSSSKFRKDPIIEKAKTYIKNNIYKKLKADEVAAHVNLSENYFTAYFKEKTHENFSNYVVHLKMEHAKEILKTSHKSIGEISFLLGYEDYRSFNRVFKKITGKKPTEFRQLYEQEC